MHHTKKNFQLARDIPFIYSKIVQILPASPASYTEPINDTNMTFFSVRKGLPKHFPFICSDPTKR